MHDYPPLTLTCPDPGAWIFSGVLESRAMTLGDRPFLQFMEEPPLSYAEVNRRVNRLAHGLQALAVGRGDRVLVMLPNCMDFLLTWWAVNRLGAIEVSVNPAYKGYFLEHLVNNSGGKIMVVARDLLDRVAASEEKLTALERLVVWGEPDRPFPPFKRLRTHRFEELFTTREDPAAFRSSHRDLCAITYTSGTTGPSKGVMMTNAQCHLAAESAVNLTRLTKDDVYFVTSPLHHANALIMQVYPAMLVGARAVIQPRFSASEWVGQIRRVGATVTNLLGVMMDFVFRQPPREDDRQHRLRLVLGQPAPAAIVEAFRERFGLERVLEYYGMTEIGIVTLMPYDGFRTGSCGKAVADWFDLRIADPETDEELPPNEVGELLVRPKSPWVFSQGYWGMPEKSLEVLRNVWYHTGDALKRDMEGYYYFVDRMRDVIRRRAVNISSFDVETVITDHPAVLECAVVAVASEFAGGEDEIKACLVLHEGAELVPQEFVAWCEDRLPYFAVPRYVEVMPELPRTPSNKVQKHLMRQMGITGETWDRIKAGHRLKEEIRKMEHAHRGRPESRDAA